MEFDDVRAAPSHVDLDSMLRGLFFTFYEDERTIKMLHVYLYVKTISEEMTTVTSLLFSFW